MIISIKLLDNENGHEWKEREEALMKIWNKLNETQER